jgi:hypothetical protein
VLEDAWEDGAEIYLGQHDRAQDGEGITHGAAGDLQGEEYHHRAEENVQVVGKTYAPGGVGGVLEGPIEDGRGGEQKQQGVQSVEELGVRLLLGRGIH